MNQRNFASDIALWYHVPQMSTAVPTRNRKSTIAHALFVITVLAVTNSFHTKLASAQDEKTQAGPQRSKPTDGPMATKAFDGEYSGQGHIAPLSGGCAPIDAIILTITGKKAVIESYRVIPVQGIQMQHHGEYSGVVSGAGAVTVEGSFGFESHAYKWKGSGAIHGAIFSGQLESGVIINGTLRGAVCTYKCQLKRQ